ncbi:MAG: hypothetical protein KJ956_07215 [Actinobacteria bacterium]|nr:hypothetical protein [Actinomycetota bacterium]
MSTRAGPLDRMAKDQIRDLLAKGWLTHDGMWFVHVAAELGIERANALNRAAIHSMSEIEVGRLLDALGVDAAALTTSDQVCSLLADGLAVVLPDSISSRISLSAPDPTAICIEWDEGECFAYRGMRRVGLLDWYECGVLYRIECWLETLGIRHEVDPPVGRCRMRIDGRCASEVRLEFRP